MRFATLLAPEAIADLGALEAARRSVVRKAIELHLRHEPTKVSKSRIKRLRGVARPHFRLRIEEIRVFYDVVGGEVHVLAIVPKPDAARWLEQFGEPR